MQKVIENPVFHRLFLIILVIFFYGNTIHNGYVLDDTLVISNNKFVQKGISGIPDILSHDSFYGASGKTSKLSGGRYRPLSLVSFAIERDFFGYHKEVFHLFNIIFYVILCLLIYQFIIENIFKGSSTIAFCCTFLYAIHPIHTEVVSNIKSRDEIFSMLFIILSLFFLLRYLRNSKIHSLVISLISFFLALLSKENGLVFLVLIPVTIYFFSKKKIRNIFLISLPYWLLLSGYIFLRYSINKIKLNAEENILNSPYLLATATEKYASILANLIRYFKLMIFPYPLSYDYCYNQLPYNHFGDLIVIFSILILTFLTVYTITAFQKKNIASYCIIFFLASEFLISNTLVNIGAPIAERFMFGPVLFFIIPVVFILNKFLETIKFNLKIIILSLLTILCVFSFIEVRSRNADWKSNLTLYLKDVKTVPESARANSFCGITIVSEMNTVTDSIQRIQKLKEANNYFRKSYNIYKENGTMYQDWGNAFYFMNLFDSAEWAWNNLKRLKPESIFNAENEERIAKYHYSIYNNKYNELLKTNNYPLMLDSYRQAVKYYDKMPESWLLLGELYRVNDNMDSALICWRKAIEIQPGYQKAIDQLNKYTSK